MIDEQTFDDGYDEGRAEMLFQFRKRLRRDPKNVVLEWVDRRIAKAYESGRIPNPGLDPDRPGE